MMSPAELGLTPAQFQNFQLLEQFLRRPLDAEGLRFSMSYWCRDRGGHDCEITEIPTCGAVCCALGCGPFAGVHNDGASTWADYCEAEFCHVGDDIYNWVFSPNWQWSDKTALGAADRIRQLLEHGCPATAGVWTVPNNDPTSQLPIGIATQEPQEPR